MSFPKKYSSSVKNIIKSSVIAAAFLASASVFAGAPQANVGGNSTIDIEVPPILNAGLAIGGDMALEVSVGTIHGDSSVNGDHNVTIAMGRILEDANILGIGLGGGLGGIVNAGLVIGGDFCGKVAVGSIGASTCTYGDGPFAAEGE
ncbi:MAG: hypothetical protein V4629_12120 [Pseudomonadota bacterium]